MTIGIFRRKYYRSEIARLDREIKQISREIGYLEKELGTVQPPDVSSSRLASRPSAAKAGAPATEDRRRFVSYLSTGSFQTIREYKFKSDLIRKKRIIWTVVLLLVAVGVFIAVNLLRRRL